MLVSKSNLGIDALVELSLNHFELLVQVVEARLLPHLRHGAISENDLLLGNEPVYLQEEFCLAGLRILRGLLLLSCVDEV